MSTKVAVVIPVYSELGELEKISLDRCRKILGRYPIVFVAPEGKNFSYFESGDMVANFPEKYFQSTQTYSTLLLTPQFYETFLDFDYILIYQLDAFVFYDALEEFCALGYDYIGSPLPRHTWQGSRKPKTPQVGNGGFSLRKVKACRNLLIKMESLPYWSEAHEEYIEDAFFSSCGVSKDIDFNVAPIEVANLFALEWYPDRQLKRFGLPFGCHHWTKMNADFYVKLFARFGYDLQPFREQMKSKDYCVHLPVCLSNLAMERLARAAANGRSILHYLPTKKFASIRIIRSPAAQKILSQLWTEEKSMINKLFIYDEENWTALLQDVKAEDLPHLLIVADYDKSLVEALEQRCGLRYGKDFVSLQREYVNHCEKIFHKLGR
ncbi:MAG: hypothetical protein IJ685_13350 [Selenomonadaceae bacterium]|nr:hypothetical protein [Selenomonadaceae bacterium]